MVVSDFLSDLQRLKIPLSRLRARGHDVLLLQLLDPAEIHFEDSGNRWIKDLETGKRIAVDPRRATQEYQQRFAEHQALLQSSARACECDWHLILTSTPLESALSDVLTRREQMTRGRVRRRNRGGAVS